MDPANTLVSYEVAFRDAVRGAFDRLGIVTDPVIESPRSSQADLCLVTFPLAKALKKPLQEISDMILQELGADARWELGASGGYLNCNFKDDPFIPEMATYIWSKGEGIGVSGSRNEKATIEHTSANPNGPFHVGRARNPIIGDTLVRSLRMVGYDVEAQYWVNDMGKQVMILAWGIKNISEKELPESARDKEDHKLVRYYQAANAMMEEDDQVKREINILLKNYEEAVKDGNWDMVISDPKSVEIKAADIRDACKGVLQGMTESLSRLGVNIDTFIYESQVVEDHSLWDVIDDLKKSSLFRDEDGANFLDLSDLIKGGDEDQFKRRFVFTRSDGSALYTTRDLAYHKWKLDRCDLAVNVLGEDHRYQSTMLQLALKELNVQQRPEVVFYAFVSLPDGKMSTRRNRVVFLDDLLDEAIDRAREEVLKRRDDLTEEELKEISETVGTGALRFNMIKVQPEKKMVFHWEDALSFEGSSAPFVQYSHARACSILRKFGGPVQGEMDWSKLVEPAEKDLVKKLAGFPAVIEKAALEWKMHLIPLYLVGAASAFNEFYRDCPVLTEPDQERKLARLAVVRMTRDVLASGLGPLGIRAPEMM